MNDMLKIVIFVLIVLGFIGVVILSYHLEDDGRKNELESLDRGKIETIEAYGEKHQYLLVDRGLTHLPNCKYCREKAEKSR